MEPLPPHLVLHPVIPLLVERLAALPTVRRVWLFGSRATGKAYFNSDIDIAIDADDPNALVLYPIYDWLEETAPTLLDVDLVPIHQMDPHFKNRALKEGVLLYERYRDSSPSQVNPTQSSSDHF
jgi:predicted nucleotidyltransferase